MNKAQSDANELAEFRKKFWANVRSEVEKNKDLNMTIFLRQAQLTGTEFQLLEKGGEDFKFDRVYRIKNLLGCSFSDLFSGL